MYCGKCGAKINNKVLFCTECGEKVIFADDENTQNTVSSGTDNNSVLNEQTNTLASNAFAENTSEQVSGVTATVVTNNYVNPEKKKNGTAQTKYAKCICPECGAKNQLNALNCIQCGEQIKRSKLDRECNMCHSVMTHNNFICPACKWDIINSKWSSTEAHREWQVTTGMIQPTSYSSKSNYTSQNDTVSDYKPQRKGINFGNILGIIPTVLLIFFLIWINCTNSGKIFLNDTIAQVTDGEGYVEMITGSRVDYLNTTYGNLINQSFSNVEWSYFKTDSGERIVQLDAIIKYQSDTVCIQFLITPEEDDMYWIEPKFMSINGISIRNIFDELYNLGYTW